MIVLGISPYQPGAAACLLDNGRVSAAASEEHFLRVRHWAGFPIEAIRYCLAQGGLRLDDVDCVAVNNDATANLTGRLRMAVAGPGGPSMLLNRLKNRQRRPSIESILERAFPEGTFNGIVQPVEHHLAHLASAYYTSPFERAVALSLEGAGDISGTVWGVGEGTRIGTDGNIFLPHSLGIFFQAMTQYLGFTEFGDEHKIMGLAPYGEATYLDEMRRIVRIRPDTTFELDLRYFTHHRENVPTEWEGAAPALPTLWDAELETLLGPARIPGAPVTPRHTDIARSVQAMYEEVLYALLESLHARYGTDHLVLAGDCIANTVATGGIYTHTPFRRLYVPPVPGDSGGAMGAALAAWHLSEPDAPRHPLSHAALGPSFSDREIGLVIKDNWDRLRAQDCAIRNAGTDEELCATVSDAIAAGRVVGWFQGRMEWSPYPLGGRSVLADPRREGMKDAVARKIHRRESFHPFSPSVLREDAGKWFQVDDDVPFMAQGIPVRPERAAEIPAVTHVDGSARAHTVTRNDTPLFYKLISAFAERTGVPVLLNAPFDEYEPQVRHPQEALECFLRTDMDLLVLGRHLIERRRTLVE